MKYTLKNLISKDNLLSYYSFKAKESGHELEQKNWIKWWYSRKNLFEIENVKFKTPPRFLFRKTMAIKKTRTDPVFTIVNSIEKQRGFESETSPLDKLFDMRFKYLKGE